MDSKSARSGDIGNLQRAAQGIEEQPGTQTPALPIAVHGEPCQVEPETRLESGIDHSC